MGYEEFEKNFNMQNEALNDFSSEVKSSVKLIKNTKGVNWEVRVVKGEEHLLEGLMLKAVEMHNKLKKELESDTHKL